MKQSKRDHLSKAKELLASLGGPSIRYAALELRFCIELMTYEKLNSFQKYLPKSFTDRTWQPPQLLKTMMQLDSIADQSFELHVSKEAVYGIAPKDEEFQMVGQHKAFGYAWLKKNYNKLGSLLHASQIDWDEEDQQRKYLSEILAEVEQAQEGAILGLCCAEPLNFTCDLCGEPSSASLHYARKTQRVTCLNPGCELEYLVHDDGADVTLQPLTAEIVCKACGKEGRIQQRHLRPNLVFACRFCKRSHILACKWAYAMVPGESQLA